MVNNPCEFKKHLLRSVHNTQDTAVVAPDYSGRQKHTKHSSISVNPVQSCEYVIPSAYPNPGIAIASVILQRILREYKHRCAKTGPVLAFRVLRQSVAKRVIIAGGHTARFGHLPPSQGTHPTTQTVRSVWDQKIYSSDRLGAYTSPPIHGIV